MKIITILLFILVSCKSTPPQEINGDEIDKILYLKKTNELKNLIPILGEPEEVDKRDKEVDEYYFYKIKNQMPIKVFVNKKQNKISSIGLAYLVKFDAYDYLKKRFNKYKWIETPIKSKSTHVVEELYKVEIPELGITFQYDNQDPYRRPDWIIFK